MNSFANIVLLFCCFLFGYSIGFDGFYVEKSGHSKVKPGEIAVVFYMTVGNAGKKSVKVFSKSVKCCWIHAGTNEAFDCEYPLDRVGRCVFHLWHMDEKIAHTIRFNTTISKATGSSWLGSLYEKISGEKQVLQHCGTVDLDPRRKCKPVNCVQKYNGKRNFFRKETKLCEPVHECLTSRDEDGLPTTAFDKDHNRCKSLIQKELTVDEERNLKYDDERRMEASEKRKYKSVGLADPMPVNCHHGKRVGDICVCENGWKTDTANVPLGDPKFVYNWCNIRTRKKPFLPYKQQKYFMITGLSLTSFTLLLSWLWMIRRFLFSPEDIKYDKPRHGSAPLFWKNKRSVDTDESKALVDKHHGKKQSMKALSQQTTGTCSNKAEPTDKQAPNPDMPEDDASLSTSNHPEVARLKSKLIQKGKSALSFNTPVSENLSSAGEGEATLKENSHADDMSGASFCGEKSRLYRHSSDGEQTLMESDAAPSLQRNCDRVSTPSPSGVNPVKTSALDSSTDSD